MRMSSLREKIEKLLAQRKKEKERWWSLLEYELSFLFSSSKIR